jgi:copper chaperone NosL
MRVLAVLAVLLLGACVEEGREMPPPIALDEDALGHYCQMNILEHAGPKGQIHLSGWPMPIWFGQVRDGVAYIKAKERAAEVVAFYVNDMGAAEDWEEPGNNWVTAEAAFFVVGSDAVGGMGAPEVVPFAVEAQARAFAQARGGAVKRLSEIAQQDVLAPVDLGALPEASQ